MQSRTRTNLPAGTESGQNRSVPGSLTPLKPTRDGAPRWKLRVGGGPDPANPGKYRTVSRTFIGTEAAAKRQLSKLVAELDERRVIAGGNDTMTALVERWMELTNHQPSTARTYRGLVKRYIAPGIGKVPISQLEPMHIERVLLHMRRSGLSDRTVQQAYSIMHAALERAFRWGLVAYNPASRVDRPRSTRHEIRLPEMRDLVRGIAEVREFDPLLGEIAAFLLFSTGLRRGELCALRWDDVDLPGRKIHVRHAIDADARSLKTPKSGQRREIPLDPLSVGLLEQRWREATRNAEQGKWTRDDTGRMNLRPDSLTQDWSAATKRVELDGVRLHDLRHGHVSLLMAAGVPIPEISKRMGHASKVMTLDVYSHFSPANAAAPTALERVQLALLRPED
jgi:integrase